MPCLKRYSWYAHDQRRRIFKVTETCAECIRWCLSRKCARLQFFLEQMSFRTLFRCPLVSVKHWKAQCLWNTEKYWYCKKEKKWTAVFPRNSNEKYSCARLEVRRSRRLCPLFLCALKNPGCCFLFYNMDENFYLQPLPTLKSWLRF